MVTDAATKIAVLESRLSDAVRRIEALERSERIAKLEANQRYAVITILGLLINAVIGHLGGAQ